MTAYQHTEEEAIQRTKPKFNDPRFYYLKELKDLVLKGFKHIKPTNSDTLLDYGCGAMPYKSLIVTEFGLQYKGADLIENKLANITIEPDGKVLNQSNEFDLILSTQVLEHVPLCYKIILLFLKHHLIIYLMFQDFYFYSSLIF
jgi:2-polyprenyl-3-methyl-5-hydroxy-6-metoxy-1,4-benzoquinol methylase